MKTLNQVQPAPPAGTGKLPAAATGGRGSYVVANFESSSVHIEVWRIQAAHFINCSNNEEGILTLYIHGGPQHFTLNDYPEMN